ncbi:2OG-Fe(II) oxygenase family protein [Mesorhizobium sp.]|uniref:2OG-Fe(II) oxygenase family protein n=1 Tax=Mesorhizobium sp. TaxID=1871066 RepID=UPI00338EFFA3
MQDDNKGLQVGYDGSWVNVDDSRNDGRQHRRLLEPHRMDTLRATVHRVVKPPAGTERISVPVFFSARLDGTGGTGARTGSIQTIHCPAMSEPMF